MEISLMGFLLQSVIFLGGLVKIFVDMQVRFKEIEVRLNHVESFDEQISKQLANIAETLAEIRLELKDKQDRT